MPELIFDFGKGLSSNKDATSVAGDLVTHAALGAETEVHGLKTTAGVLLYADDSDITVANATSATTHAGLDIADSEAHGLKTTVDGVLMYADDSPVIVESTTETKETRVAHFETIDLNAAPNETLYTVPNLPTTVRFVTTRIVLRNASASATTASVSFGYNSTAFNDVIANATHTELTGATLYTILVPKVGAKLGAPTDVLTMKKNTLEGTALTVAIDVFGYFVILPS